MSERITIRISVDERKQLEELADLRGEDLSSLIRRGIKRELAALGVASDDTRRALGLDLQPRVRGNPLAGGG